MTQKGVLPNEILSISKKMKKGTFLELFDCVSWEQKRWLFDSLSKEDLNYLLESGPNLEMLIFIWLHILSNRKNAPGDLLPKVKEMVRQEVKETDSL